MVFENMFFEFFHPEVPDIAAGALIGFDPEMYFFVTS